MGARQRPKVAVVGSGMAGLVTAWLLKQDPKQLYEVEVFENSLEPSLDYASLSVINERTGKPERIDVPMRAFTEGYYHNLKAMYDHLNIKYQVQPFLFSFCRVNGRDANAVSNSDDKQYFVHASNNHRLPPIKPRSSWFMAYVAELLLALICYTWFSLSCLFVPTEKGSIASCGESFGEYLNRIKLPQYFVRWYLLPLMSAVTTCPHKDLLNFPAEDIIGYKRRITSGRQLVVSAGVNEVQHKLVHGIKVSCSSQVISVQSEGDGVKLRWRNLRTPEQDTIHESKFDKVVLAVPPNVVGSIYEPLKKEMQYFPTMPVDTIVYKDDIAIELSRSIEQDGERMWFNSSYSRRAHVIHLRTTGGSSAQTEATHIQPSGVMVTSCPLSSRNPAKVIRHSRFTRVLRTPESRQRTNRLFGQPGLISTDDEKKTGWTSGDDGVYLVGSWCWDGMVLLEGCVVSAMRAASAMGVQPPWRSNI